MWLLLKGEAKDPHSLGMQRLLQTPSSRDPSQAALNFRGLGDK